MLALHCSHSLTLKQRQEAGSMSWRPTLHRPSYRSRCFGRLPIVMASADRSVSAQALSVAQPGSSLESGSEVEVRPGVFEGYWQWDGYRIRYQRSGNEGPPVICVHGFGANCES